MIALAFEQGVPVALDGERLGPTAMVEALNRVAGARLGRVDLVENRLVGMKSRGVYAGLGRRDRAAPGPSIAALMS